MTEYPVDDERFRQYATVLPIFLNQRYIKYGVWKICSKGELLLLSKSNYFQTVYSLQIHYIIYKIETF